MSYWTIIENPPQETLDRLFNERVQAIRNCPDCGVTAGKKHLVNCDVSRCATCGGQAFSCDCKKPVYMKWTGIWPGVRAAYKKGYLVKDPSGKISFDLNRVAVEGLRDEDFP